VIQDEQAFLKELQINCLSETHDSFAAMQGAMGTFKQNPWESIECIQRVIHSMKGNFQAVAFLCLAGLLHSLEDTLEKKSRFFNPKKSNLNESDQSSFEVLLSATLESMKSYVAELKKVGVDSEDLRKPREDAFEKIANWTPGLTAGNLAVAKNSTPRPHAGFYLLFQNGSQYFAVPVDLIEEVIKAKPLSLPPYKKKNLSGLINLRGEVLPILNIEEIMTSSIRSANYVFVSKVRDLKFGFQVETVHRVISLELDSFQSVNRYSQFCQIEDKTIAIVTLSEVVAG
jgi:chemotaxis signal transduction protein